MTKGLAVLLLALAILFVTASQLIIKARLSFLHIEFSSWSVGGELFIRILSDAWLWLGFFLLVSSALCWYLAMIKLPISLMLPVGALVAPIVSVGAYFMLGEELSAAKSTAIMWIALGVLWLGWLNT